MLDMVGLLHGEATVVLVMMGSAVGGLLSGPGSALDAGVHSDASL
jgi:hypothetical protein